MKNLTPSAKRELKASRKNSFASSIGKITPKSDNKTPPKILKIYEDLKPQILISAMKQLNNSANKHQAENH